MVDDPQVIGPGRRTTLAVAEESVLRRSKLSWLLGRKSDYSFQPFVYICVNWGLLGRVLTALTLQLEYDGNFITTFVHTDICSKKYIPAASLRAGGTAAYGTLRAPMPRAFSARFRRLAARDSVAWRRSRLWQRAKPDATRHIGSFVACVWGTHTTSPFS